MSKKNDALYKKPTAKRRPKVRFPRKLELERGVILRETHGLPSKENERKTWRNASVPA